MIVGAGFAGLDCAKELGGAPVDVTVVDRNNHHTFQPLLYQVATSALTSPDVAYPLRGILRRFANVSFRHAEVEAVSWPQRQVLLDGGRSLAFDYLVVAAGASTAWFGAPGAEENALPLYRLDDAIDLRNHLLRQFETAEWEREEDGVAEGRLTFVIVGGGPTGVEMAGALRELVDHVLAKDFRSLDLSRARVVLVEMAESVLASFSAPARRHAAEGLRRRGVEVRVGAKVAEITPEAVILASGDRLATRTVIWAAVRGNRLAEVMGLEQTQGGRMVVDRQLAVPGHPGVFAVGDIAAVRDADGHLLPQLAPVAKQSGAFAGQVILAAVSGRAPGDFRFHDRGTMATIGRDAAVADLPNGVHLSGRIAWLAWLFLHLSSWWGSGTGSASSSTGSGTSSRTKGRRG